MRVFRNIFSQLHTFILWLLMSVIFWGWIFTLITDTNRNRKVTVFVDVPELEERELAVKLEEELPKGLKMIKVHTFDYDIIGTGALAKGDVYIARESQLRSMLEQAPDCMAELPLPEGCTGYTVGGKNYGILIYDAKTRSGSGTAYIPYWYGEETENYYLCINADSPHLEARKGAVDNAAWEVALHLLQLGPDRP